MHRNSNVQNVQQLKFSQNECINTARVLQQKNFYHNPHKDKLLQQHEGAKQSGAKNKQEESKKEPAANLVAWVQEKHKIKLKST